MNTADILKEYLVSIGFNVNNSSLNQFRRSMNSAGSDVEDFAGKTVAGFAKGAAGFTSFLVMVNAGLSKYISGLGQADLQTQIFARRMWMSIDGARAYQSSMSALGASLQDLYLSPELMQRYLLLRNQALGMQMNDKDYESAMKGVRDMTFEFQRLKLEGMYALQWIGYYLTKYIDPVLRGSGISLKDINDTIQQKMPQWTEKVAQIASWFVRLGVAAWDARGALAAIMAIFMAPKLLSLATSPVFLMIAGLTALLLLLDDYKTYESGGKSLFSNLWKSLDDNGTLKSFGQGFDDVKQSLKDVFTSLGDLAKALDKKGALDLGIQTINASLLILSGTLEGIAGLIDLVAGGLSGLTTGDWSNFQKGFDVFKNAPDKWRKYVEDNILKGVTPGGSSNKTDAAGNPVPTSYAQTPLGGSTGATLLSYSSDDPNAPWGKRIYDVLSAYIPQISSSLGIKIKGTDGQAQFNLASFTNKMNQFMSNAQPAATWVNYSPWQALYGSKTTNHAMQVSNKPTFNIYGAKDPNTTARTVNSAQNQLLTRVFRGVQV